MRNTLTLGLVALTALAACGTGYGTNNDVAHVPACQEQSDLARQGKVPSGEIAISCPKHGIGDFQ